MSTVRFGVQICYLSDSIDSFQELELSVLNVSELGQLVCGLWTQRYGLLVSSVNGIVCGGVPISKVIKRPPFSIRNGTAPSAAIFGDILTFGRIPNNIGGLSRRSLVEILLISFCCEVIRNKLRLGFQFVEIGVLALLRPRASALLALL